MKRKTYNNMVKAVKMIMAKGYDKETANDIAIRIFDFDMKFSHNGMPAEWFIEKLAEV